MASMIDPLRHLVHARVDFVLVGGMAGVVHGSSTVTRDLDICAEFTDANMARLLVALDDLHPMLGRGPLARPVAESASELAASSDMQFQTDLGPLDVLPEIRGVGAWHDVRVAADTIDLGDGLTCRVLGIDALLAAKRALGRTRDRLAASELEDIRRRLRDGG